MNRTIPRTLVAVLCLACADWHTTNAAPVSPISPGDIIFTEFFNGWHKLDSVTGQVAEITDWNSAFPPVPAGFVRTITFDHDGSLLYNAGSSIFKLNPRTGAVTSVLSFTGSTSPTGFVVEPDGSLLIADGIAGISRFSRSTETLTTIVPGGGDFSPRGIVQSSGGRIFVVNSPREVLEVNLASGTTSPIVDLDFSLTGLIASRADGLILVEGRFPQRGLYRINPDTGETTLFANDNPIFTQGFAFGSNDNLWLTGEPDGLIKYDSAGGARIPIYDATFFGPRAITVVPIDWTPPPVPEPNLLALLLSAFLTSFASRRSRWAVGLRSFSSRLRQG